MDRSDCIVYIGEYFTVEWYYDSDGYSQAYEYFLSINADQKRKFFILVKRIAEFGKIMDKTKFRNEGDEVYAFKPKPDRYLAFFIKGKKLIITNAFYKRTDKLPKKEKERAIKNIRDYLNRMEESK
jgi:phage-related protein